MNINGLQVDADAIGHGMYAMICDKGDDALVAFGMIPQWCIDLMRKPLREKIISEGAKQRGLSADDVAPFVDEAAISKTMNAIEHQVVLAIYRAAKDAGKMVV